MVEDVIVGFDPKGGEANMRFNSQLSRMKGKVELHHHALGDRPRESGFTIVGISLLNA